MPSTKGAESTRTATSWVMVVSREEALPKSRVSSLKTSGWSSRACRRGAGENARPSTLKSAGSLPEVAEGVDVRMVNERSGILSFLVRRKEAEMAFCAERRAP